MRFSTQAGGGMPEIGLLPFARVALDVATTVLPTYRSRFSKHQFTQPQLLAILCLMRYEDWTFREAEVRLREHRDLREVLHLQVVPDYTTLYRFLRRLEEDTIARGLGETVRRLRGGRRRGRVSAAVDGKGRGSTRGRFRDWWTRPPNTFRCAWCLPMPSLIPKPTTNIFGSAGERRALSRRNRAGGFPKEFCVERCTGSFRRSAMDNARRSKPSFRWSSANSPPALRAAAWLRRSAKPCYSA